MFAVRIAKAAGGSGGAALRRQAAAVRPAAIGNQAVLRRSRLVVGHVDDPMEHEAERVADTVMRMALPGTALASGMSDGREQVSRACAACEEEARRMPSQPGGAARGGEAAPASVDAALAAPGRPLDPAARRFLEPRFGRGLGDLRVHDDAQAADSAAAVGARAYTVGRHIVFGAAAYRPDEDAGLRLLAHEVAHTVQQGGAPLRLDRACLPSAVCDPPEAKAGSQEDFVNKTQNTPVQKSKEDIRKAACGKAPPDPSCTADGHGRRATAAEAFLRTASPGRLDAVTGVFVDMDMPDAWAGNTVPCGQIVPPIAAVGGKRCTLIHDSMEKEAALYNAGENSIAGKDRRTWAEFTIRLLTHETEHALFSTAQAAGTAVKDPAIACDFDANRKSLTELAAIISEFKPVHHKAMALDEPKRTAELDWWFNFWIKTGGENIAGNVKALRCSCDCDPANAYINKMFDFASAGWNSYEKFVYNKNLADPKWALDWPVKGPASVSVNDLPEQTTDVQDLPSAKKP